MFKLQALEFNLTLAEHIDKCDIYIHHGFDSQSLKVPSSSNKLENYNKMMQLLMKNLPAILQVDSRLKDSY